MKLILLKDLENVGKKNDVVDVKDGYGRNFLIPKDFAKLATQSALKELEAQKATARRAEEESLRLTQALASSLDSLEVQIQEKTEGEGGKLFGSITAVKISKKLKELGYDVNSKHIKLKEPIKEIGEYKATVELDHGLEAEIKVNVVSNVVSEE